MPASRAATGARVEKGILEVLREFIRESNPDRVRVGFSGGLDSSVLLHAVSQVTAGTGLQGAVRVKVFFKLRQGHAADLRMRPADFRDQVDYLTNHINRRS